MIFSVGLRDPMCLCLRKDKNIYGSHDSCQEVEAQLSGFAVSRLNVKNC